jgi:N-acetylmuramoyl-L-alanine amidase
VTFIAVCLALAGPVDLEDLAARRDFVWTADAATGRHVVRTGSLQIAFAPNVATALRNGVPMRLSAPVVVLAGRVKLPAELAAAIEEIAPERRRPVQPLVAAPAPRPAAPVERPRGSLPITIVVDPGHGGMHTGGKGRTGLLEKDINLDVSLELKRLLEELGARVVMTRTNDRHFSSEVDEDLNVRVDIANRAAPDLFLSVHTNWVEHPVARGYEVWVPKNARGTRDAESRRLAKAILGELGQVWTSDDRGIKDDHNLRVLKGTTCPAALVELEFVSNPQAERQLARRDVRVKLAEALADAVRRWAAGR